MDGVVSGAIGPPSWGEVWLVTLDPTRGHEQAGTRPAVVVSANGFNQSPAGLVIVAPMTTVNKRIPWHVQLDPPQGGVRQTSYVKCEDIRSVSTERLVDRWGILTTATMDAVADRLRVLLQL